MVAQPWQSTSTAVTGFTVFGVSVQLNVPLVVWVLPGLGGGHVSVNVIRLRAATEELHHT